MEQRRIGVVGTVTFLFAVVAAIAIHKPTRNIDPPILDREEQVRRLSDQTGVSMDEIRAGLHRADLRLGH